MQSPLVVVFVKKVLQRGDVQLGILMSAMGVGGILGGIVTGILGSRAKRIGAIGWLFIADGLLLTLFAINRNFPLGVAIFALFGTVGSTVHIILLSIFQTHVPDEKRGRVFANLTPILGPLSIVSIGVGTFLADMLGVVYVLIASGIAEFASGIYGTLRRFVEPSPAQADYGTPEENRSSVR
jgi:MFS family permease